MNKLNNVSPDVKEKVDKIIENLGLDGYTIGYQPATRAVTFKKEFKMGTVPLALVERELWADIRQIFRAVFQAGPQVENFSAHNEWSRWTAK